MFRLTKIFFGGSPLFRFVPQRQRRVLTEPCRGGASALPTEDRLNRFSLPVGSPLYHRDKNPSIREKYFRKRLCGFYNKASFFFVRQKRTKKATSKGFLLAHTKIAALMGGLPLTPVRRCCIMRVTKKYAAGNFITYAQIGSSPLWRSCTKNAPEKFLFYEITYTITRQRKKI